MTDLLSIVRELSCGATHRVTHIPHGTGSTPDNATVPGGAAEYVRVVREQPLLDELADYVSGAARTGAASARSGYGSRVLISSDALEVMQHIEHTVYEYGMRGEVKGQVLAWAHACADAGDYQQAQALQLAMRWREQIQAMRYSAHELTAPCPVCDCERVCEQSIYGDSHVLKRALCYTVKKARCRACGAVWEGQEGMRELAQTLSQDF